MKVFLKSLSGQKTSLEVHESATVRELKEILAASVSSEPRLLKLILVGKILEDARSLEESGVKDGDQVVYMINKPKPETPPPADDPELALGEQYETTLQQLVDLGFPRSQAASAMRSANNDPSLAYELLVRGAPLDSQGDEEEGDEAEAEGNPLAFLLENDAFLTIRRQLQTNPSLLTNFLNQLQENNPELFALISEYPDEFQDLLDAEEAAQPAEELGEPSDSDESPLSASDRASIDKLIALGFTEVEALEAYLSCDRNEELAANFLFESQGNSYKRSAIVKKWEPRYFQLRSSTLTYYKRQPGLYLEKPRKVWPLGQLEIEHKEETRGNYFIFRITVKSSKTTYTLGTLTALETKEWVEALRTQESTTTPRPAAAARHEEAETSSDLEMEDVPLILKKAIPVFEKNQEWKLVGDALWTSKDWHKSQIVIPFALKEMVSYFTDQRAQWDFSLSELRTLSDSPAFKLVLLQMGGEQTVVIQSAVRISPRQSIVIMESLNHINYPSTWQLTDYFLIEKNKVAGATLVTRFLKSSRSEVVARMVESFRTFPNFMQLEAMKGDMEDFNVSFVEMRHADSQADVSISRRAVSLDECFVYGPGTHFVRDEVGGGLIFLDKVLIGKQKKVLGHMLRSMASNIAKGQSIINVSLPVNIFEPKSILERMLASFGYAPIFLDQASTSTGIQRMKFVLAWAITIFHTNTDQGKPFNPILGETFQGMLGTATCHAEQTSHHPPISNFQMFGNGYVIFGFHEWIVNTGTNSVKGRSKGRTVIKFPDSTLEVSLPWVLISGTLIGKRVFNWTGVLSVVDPSNHLFGEIILNPNKKGFFSRSATPSDYFKGQISQLPDDHVVFTPAGFDKIWSSGKKTILDSTVESLCSIEGYWPLYMDADSERVWSFDSVRPYLIVKTPEVLPSDSRLREDIVELGKGDEEAAQVQKDRLENIQRRDKQLREQWRKSQKSAKR